MRVSSVAKFITSAIAAGVIALNVAIGDDVLTATEAVTIGLAVLQALGVYVIPNAPEPVIRARDV